MCSSDLTAFVALSVTTLGWNPLRSVGRGVIVGGDAAGRTMKAVADRSREAAAQALADQRDRQAADGAAPVDGMEPEWAQDAGSAAEVADVTEDAMESVAPDADAADTDNGEIDAEGEGLPWEEEAPGNEPAEEPGVEWEDDLVEASDDEGEPEMDVEPDVLDDDGLEDPNAGVLMEHEVPPVDLLSAPEEIGRAHV